MSNQKPTTANKETPSAIIVPESPQVESFSNNVVRFMNNEISYEYLTKYCYPPDWEVTPEARIAARIRWWARENLIESSMVANVLNWLNGKNND